MATLFAILYLLSAEYRRTVRANLCKLRLVVRPDGFEPPTPCSEDRCSHPLSYGRMRLV